MDDDPRDNARLEPAVRSAMHLRGSVGCGPEATEHDPEPPAGTDAAAFTIEQYTQGLNREIEANFLIGDHETRAIVRMLSEAYGQRYSRDDLVRAVELANRLSYCAVFVQSSFGDGDQAIAELEKQVPGFSRAVYADLLGLMAYINR